MTEAALSLAESANKFTDKSEIKLLNKDVQISNGVKNAFIAASKSLRESAIDIDNVMKEYNNDSGINPTSKNIQYVHDVLEKSSESLYEYINNAEFCSSQDLVYF